MEGGTPPELRFPRLKRNSVIVPYDSITPLPPPIAENMYSEPIAYFITFTSRGTWLHGHPKGSIDRHGQWIAPEPKWVQAERCEMKQPPRMFSNDQQEVITTAIRNCCEEKGWNLFALTVCWNHVHVAVNAGDTDKRIVARSLKAAATFQLRKLNLIPASSRPWTRDASERYIFKQNELENVIGYINQHNTPNETVNGRR